ncbi:hypothetical protein [Roseiflexus sp.]|uniref:hypothetical protein n=1 Tax=Roseiflexus sp. TaxID=2562120 RepID=UPI0021DB95AF|nr:hypothetical protein [Roseiflexus sp.]GIW03055.1 MAG: hypothetical protein KatS3mg058_4458 [Roseiflexus sp.]
MAGLFQRIADAVYREYDRRIKRASLITEYGITHHHDHEEEHADNDVAIVNLSPGMSVGDEHAQTDALAKADEASEERLEIEPLATDSEMTRTPVATAEEEIEAEIINAPPGAPIPRE